MFVSGVPVSCKDIADKSNATEKQVLDAAKELQEKYNEESGIHLLIFNKKLQFCSNPNYAEEVSDVLNPIKERELSKSIGFDSSFFVFCVPKSPKIRHLQQNSPP